MNANIPANTDGGLLTPDNCAVVFIDHQPQMTFGVANIDRQLLLNNVVLLAKCTKLFGIPAVLTAVETESFSGYIWPQLLDVFPGQEVIERTSMIRGTMPVFAERSRRPAKRTSSWRGSGPKSASPGPPLTCSTKVTMFSSSRTLAVPRRKPRRKPHFREWPRPAWRA
jgi:nicotinamidase-related amidase